MKRTYRQTTPLLGIPVLGYGDKILPEVELYRHKVIENLLIAGMQGVKSCLFDEGYWRVTKTSDEFNTVVLGATGSSPAAHGVIDGAYFKVSAQISWGEIKLGGTYWLYLRATTKTMENPEAVRAVVSSHRLSEGDNCLLMATLNLREEEPKLEIAPDEKIFSKDIARHANDKENPHGLRLYQKELVVTDKLVLRSQDGTAPTIEVEVDGKAVELPANLMPEAIGQLAGRAVEIMDFDSFGPQGATLQVSGRKEVFNVTVQRRVVDAFKGVAGEIAVGYFGEDANVDEANEFAVYNSGEEGIPLRAIVFCR